jgi:hypothetical protein
MFPAIDLNPEGAATVLDALAEDLASDPGLLTARPELQPNELAAAAGAARVWAVMHGVPAACVPAAPFDASNAAAVLYFLTGLAEVIRYFASQTAPFETVKELVETLRLREDPAVREFVHVEASLKQLLASLQVIAGQSVALTEALGHVTRHGEDPTQVASVLREAQRIQAGAERAVVACLEVCRTVKAWEVTPVGAPTTRPS